MLMFKHVNAVFHAILAPMSRIARASLIIAFFFTLDKGLAFFRAILFNHIVGLDGMGILGASNNIPDYLSALISGGALGMAFIPVLTEYLERGGRPAAWNLFSRIVNLAFVVTAFFSALLILLANPLVRYIVAPDFLPDKQMLTVSLMRLDFVAILIFSISGLVMSALQANQHFLLPAMAPFCYNVGQIFGGVILAPSQPLRFGPITLPAFGLGLHGIVYGVIIGALCHLLIQVPGLLHFQFRWTPLIGLNDPGVRRVLLLLWPRVLTMGCIQLYYLSRDSLASRFSEAGVGALNLAWTIQQVPETIIGTAIAIALLPSLAEHIQNGRRDAFRLTVNRALRAMLALCLPAAVLLALGVRPLAERVFNFLPENMDLLTVCTWAFLLGLAGDTWLEVAVRSFYANQDTRTPLGAAAAQALAFVALAALLRELIGLAGIPLAAAITYTSEALFLLILLNKRFPGILQVRDTLLRAALAAALAGGVTWVAMTILPTSLWLTLASLAAGGLATLPFIWPEVRTLVRL